ncbi:hypothetical protein SCLCIDRAFT_9464 [Scleroderma citrinum Foug A]|uniref:Uncharacterized protein n=1 Tax=Scleroderma citrinum Foug A TaxID=1036808 RepID=A0A0C3DYN2_9AGAM|nr:hypothetical protein SCLCIDRAFT_9464 [Scleroderma citrinum Foug A]
MLTPTSSWTGSRSYCNKQQPTQTVSYKELRRGLSPYGGLEDDTPSIEDTKAEDIDMPMNPTSTRPPSQRDTSALVRLTGNSIEVHPSQDERVDENRDDIPMGDQDNRDGEELPRQAERADGNGNNAGEDVSMEDQNDHNGESTHQQVQAHAKQPTGKLRATAFKNSSSVQPQVTNYIR